MTTPIDEIVRAFDPWNRTIAEDPAAFWAVVTALREAGPVVHSPAHGGFWVITGYDEVLRATRDWRTFTSSRGAGLPSPPDAPRLPPIEVDPPVHGRWRALLNRHLARPAMDRGEAEARAIADALVDGFAHRGTCDLGEDFAWQLVPTALFRLLLGVPDEEVPATRALVRRAVSFETEQQQRDALADLSTWIRGFIDRRRAGAPRGDLTDALLNGSVGGAALSADQVANALLLFVLAGMENTSSSICELAAYLIDDPTLAELLAEPDAPVDSVVEELLRHSSVSFGLSRVTTTAVTVGGTRIPAGERVFLLWASGNHDPAEFERPAEFDPARGAHGHLAFGAGPHLCLGAHFARMLLRVAAITIATRLRDLHRVPGSRERRVPGVVRSTWSMPVLFTPVLDRQEDPRNAR